jgi:hypothetical protein
VPAPPRPAKVDPAPVDPNPRPVDPLDPNDRAAELSPRELPIEPDERPANELEECSADDPPENRDAPDAFAPALRLLPNECQAPSALAEPAPPRDAPPKL